MAGYYLHYERKILSLIVMNNFSLLCQKLQRTLALAEEHFIVMHSLT